MKKVLLTSLIVVSLGLCSGMAMAWDYNNFGTNITIYDGNGDGTDSGWHKGTTSPAGIYEDQEVETFSGHYSASIGQIWDMEAFFINNKTLTMIGGFDLINGVVNTGDIYGNGYIDPGHIFIDSGSDGTYDYAIAFTNEASGVSAKAYTLTTSSHLLATKYFTGTSSPWMLAVNGEDSTDLGATYLGFSGSTDLPNIVTGGSGTHNAIQIDLSNLTLGTNFTVHFTMECGNDNLMGKVNSVPIPGAMWLLGSGLLGLVGIRRRRQS